MDECQHEFIYGGIKYETQTWYSPVHHGNPTHYFDWFFCTKCLESKYKKLVVETYDRILFSATPKEED